MTETVRARLPEAAGQAVAGRMDTGGGLGLVTKRIQSRPGSPGAHQDLAWSGCLTLRASSAPDPVWGTNRPAGTSSAPAGHGQPEDAGRSVSACHGMWLASAWPASALLLSSVGCRDTAQPRSRAAVALLPCGPSSSQGPASACSGTVRRGAQAKPCVQQDHRPSSLTRHGQAQSQAPQQLLASLRSQQAPVPWCPHAERAGGGAPDPGHSLPLVRPWSWLRVRKEAPQGSLGLGCAPSSDLPEAQRHPGSPAGDAAAAAPRSSVATDAL